MKIIKVKTAGFFSVDRDDNELRVVVCPTCGGVDVKQTNQRCCIMYEGSALPLMSCKCGAFFAFYGEDGKREISKQEAEEGKKNGEIDMQEDGKDEHGHCFYIPFKEKPPTISDKEWEEIQDLPWEEGKRKKESRFLSANQLIRNKDSVTAIDWDVVEKYKKEMR